MAPYPVLFLRCYPAHRGATRNGRSSGAGNGVLAGLTSHGSVHVFADNRHPRKHLCHLQDRGGHWRWPARWIRTHALVRMHTFSEPLREGVSNGGGGGAAARSKDPVVWKFWPIAQRREKFANSALKHFLILGTWLTIAYFPESLMLADVPASTISNAIDGDGLATILVYRNVQTL